MVSRSFGQLRSSPSKAPVKTGWRTPFMFSTMNRNITSPSPGKRLAFHHKMMERLTGSSRVLRQELQDQALGQAQSISGPGNFLAMAPHCPGKLGKIGYVGHG